MHFSEQSQEANSNEHIISYREVVDRLQHDTRRKFLPTKDRLKIIPFPQKKPEPYATVTLDYEGDFSNGKDPFGYVLRMLDLL